MATVIFYEKPGCANNSKQKAWLIDSGHEVHAKNLLLEAWDAAGLLTFFGDTPVAQWFNPSAPRVKSGEVNPDAETADSALAMMLAEPLLIRRPLMEVAGVRRVGFHAAEVRAWIGLADAALAEAAACPICHRSQPCPAPEEAI